MKSFYLIALMIFSTNTRADQSDLLAQARDHLIDQAIAHVKNYCPELASRSVDSTYICRLQIQEDCSRPSEKQKTACDLLKKVEEMEQKISLSDKNMAQLETLSLYSSKPQTVLTKPVHNQVKVSRGSQLSHYIKNAEAQKESELIDSMAQRINSLKVRVDCSSDSDCKVQEFGKKICGGPVGTFVYSLKGGENKILTEEVSRFNEADGAFIKKWNKDSVGTCDWNGRSGPAKCVEQTCT